MKKILCPQHFPLKDLKEFKKCFPPLIKGQAYNKDEGYTQNKTSHEITIFEKLNIETAKYKIFKASRKSLLCKLISVEPDFRV